VDEGLTRDELTDLYRRYGYALHRRCTVLLRDAASADDALQETFVKLLRSGAGVRNADQPLRWLQRVADRTCFDQMRRTKHLRRADSIEDESAASIAAPPGIDVEARSAALRVLSRLGDDEQSLAVMAYVDGLTQAEIARELGVSQPAIHKRLVQLRERATRALGERS
jgi:RNA polymerase sigma-70 factor (ECF subfamily)